MEMELVRCQGRTLTCDELLSLQSLIDEHPQWSRHRVAVELCRRWNWRTPHGQLKTFAAREMMLKLEQRVGLRLPAVQVEMRRRPWGVKRELTVPQLVPKQRLEAQLQDLMPLNWRLGLYGTEIRAKALGYLRQDHYLGCDRPVGSHLLYLVQDGQSRDLAVHLVGAAAWQCAGRDRFIGWDQDARRHHLPEVANHSRFLILPSVKVPHLASHMLSQLAEKLRQDWPKYHGVRLQLLESFVEVGRFAGTAYQAANWQWVGQTTGRTRQEKQHRAVKPPKAIWLYPLQKNFRAHLCAQP
jgi:hypothetical protein